MAIAQSDRKRQHVETESGFEAALDDTEIGLSRKRSKSAKVEEKKSLFVRGLPADATNESLADFFSQNFPVKHAVVVRDQKSKESRGFGFVTLADADDAAQAQKTLDKKQWNGRCIRVDIAEPRHRTVAEEANNAEPSKTRKPDYQKASKLIVRNLPWSIKKPEQLSQLFRSFGKIKFTDLPQTKGKLKGFGFVTIRGRKNAEKALQAVNGKEVGGRTLAVDWAVDKETWERHKDDDESIDDSESNPSDQVAGAHSEEGAAEKSKDEGVELDVANFIKTHMQNLENESDDEENPDDASPDKSKMENESPRQKMTDMSSTVFIRNLPFTTTDEQLKGFFAHFGTVRYARTVFDKATDKPAGTGFVCFLNQSDVKSCLKGAPRPKPSPAGAKPSLLVDTRADPSGLYTLQGRLLQVVQAVNKEEAKNLADRSLSKMKEKDKRRLYLLSEGVIGRSSPLFNLLSPAEFQMRQTSTKQRKKMVEKNASLHLSLTRLAVRNIPRNIGSKELKELARKAVVSFAQDVKKGRRQPLSKEENARDGKDVKERERQRKLRGKGIVRQVKIVFESKQGSKVPEKSGGGKSRGYGFIEYTSHHWALMGLRYLNGLELPGIDGKKQRLIVEFAIENLQVVQRRHATEVKSAQTAQLRSRNGAKSDSEDSGDDEADWIDEPAQIEGRRGKKTARNGNGEGLEDRTAGDKGAAAATKTAINRRKLIARKKMIRKNKVKARGQTNETRKRAARKEE